MCTPRRTARTARVRVLARRTHGQEAVSAATVEGAIVWGSPFVYLMRDVNGMWCFRARVSRLWEFPSVLPPLPGKKAKAG